MDTKNDPVLQGLIDMAAEAGKVHEHLIKTAAPIEDTLTGTAPSPSPGATPWVGRINLGRLDDAFSGCKAVVLRTAYDLNDWAERNTGTVVTRIIPLPSEELLVLFSSKLDEDQMFVLRERAEVIEEEVARRVHERALAIKAEAVGKETETKLLRELAEIGLRCKNNHAKREKA